VNAGEVALIASATLLIGSADFFGGVAARRSAPMAVAAWSQALGVPGLLAIAAAVGGSLIASDLALGVAAGAGSALGVSALYIGFARSAVGVVAPTAATIAAVIPIVAGLILGERPGVVAAIGIGMGIGAIILVGSTPADAPGVPKGLMIGFIAGLGFGVMVIAYAATSVEGGLWSAVSGRFAAALFVTTAVIVTGTNPRIMGSARVPTVLAGVLASVGMAAFVTVSQTADLIVLGVALGLFPTVTVLLAAVFIRERLIPTQWMGVGLAAVAVTLISVG
jgi:drug/metabolite transporter (DMT)-like permease